MNLGTPSLIIKTFVYETQSSFRLPPNFYFLQR